MTYNFYLIESSYSSNDASINPVVHSVVYTTKDTLAIKMLDFLKEHIVYLQDQHCDELDVTYLTEPRVDARLVEVLQAICNMQADDLSFACPEWATSYRIRRLPLSQNHWHSLRVLHNHKVILGVEYAKPEHGGDYDFSIINPSVRPENKTADPDAIKNPEYDEMRLTLNVFSTEGLSW